MAARCACAQKARGEGTDLIGGGTRTVGRGPVTAWTVVAGGDCVGAELICEACRYSGARIVVALVTCRTALPSTVRGGGAVSRFALACGGRGGAG